MPVSRILRRVVGDLRTMFQPKQKVWDRTPFKAGKEYNKKRPWMPVGWPYAGWFNFNPSRAPGVLPVDMPRPDVELKRRKSKKVFSIAKRNVDVVRTVDQMSLDQLRTMIFDTRGPIYAESRPQPSADEIEADFIKRLEDKERPFKWAKHEIIDLVSRRRYHAEVEGNKFEEAEEKKKLEAPVEDTAETRALFKEYAQALEGFGWKDPYKMTDAEVEEEAEVLRGLFITVPNSPFHGPQHEWTQRQDLVVEQWQEKGIPCFAGDAFRAERQPQPGWTKGYEYIGGHNEFEEQLAGPPGSYKTQRDDEDLPPGTDPDAPKPVPKFFRDNPEDRVPK